MSKHLRQLHADRIIDEETTAEPFLNLCALCTKCVGGGARSFQYMQGIHTVVQISISKYLQNNHKNIIISLREIRVQTSKDKLKEKKWNYR